MSQSNVQAEQSDIRALLGPSINWHGQPTRPWAGRWAGLTRHPMAAIFGTYEDPAYEALKWSIERLGQQEPILLYREFVIDGWHQYRACIELERHPVIHELLCDEREAIQFILEHLLKTRAVTKEARSVAQAVRRNPDYIARHGGRRQPGRGLHSTVAMRAAAAGVSTSTQRKVEHVADCCPDLLWEIVARLLSPDAAYRRCIGHDDATTAPRTCRCNSCTNAACAVHARVRALEARLRRAGISAD